MGYEIADYLMKNRIFIPYSHIGIKDTFAESGRYLDIIKKYGLDSKSIETKVKELLNRRQK